MYCWKAKQIVSSGVSWAKSLEWREWLKSHQNISDPRAHFPRVPLCIVCTSQNNYKRQNRTKKKNLIKNKYFFLIEFHFPFIDVGKLF